MTTMVNKDNFIKELKKSLVDGDRRVKPSHLIGDHVLTYHIDCDGEYDDGLQYYPDIDITCKKFDNVMKKYKCQYQWLSSYEACVYFDGEKN